MLQSCIASKYKVLERRSLDQYRFCYSELSKFYGSATGEATNAELGRDKGEEDGCLHCLRISMLRRIGLLER